MQRRDKKDKQKTEEPDEQAVADLIECADKQMSEDKDAVR